jgi:hypothetical protein
LSLPSPAGNDANNLIESICADASESVSSTSGVCISSDARRLTSNMIPALSSSWAGGMRRALSGHARLPIDTTRRALSRTAADNRVALQYLLARLNQLRG